MFLLAEVKYRTPIHIIRVVDPEIVHTHPPRREIIVAIITWYLTSRPYGYIAHSTSCHLLPHMGVETYSMPASGHTSQQDGNSKFVIFK
jgi:hypothetical protein